MIMLVNIHFQSLMYVRVCMQVMFIDILGTIVVIQSTFASTIHPQLSQT